MFARFSYIPTLAYNLAMEKCTRRQWYNRIDDKIVLGALPFRKTAHRLIKEENIGGVVSMNEDYELVICVGPKGWKELGIDFLQLSTVDIFSAPDQAKLIRGVEFIDKFKNTDKSVYVHCKAGRTRSATLVACYLMWKYDMTPAEAVSFIIIKRPHILLHSKQWQAIRTFYNTFSPHNRQSS